MLGFQAAGAAPIFYDKIVANPETVATAIRIGNPASWQLATAAIRDQRGAIDIVTDAEILEAQRFLAAQRRHLRRARQRRLHRRPAQMPRRRALRRLPARPHIPEGARIVCTVTGHGLKDPDIAREQCGSIIPAKAEKAEIMKLL